MIIRHWSAKNTSGMHHVAQACAEAETRLGHTASVVDVANTTEWEAAATADIHVCHTHFPDKMRAVVRNRTGHDARVVFTPHGTPEHIMANATSAVEHPGYGPADGWMMLRHWLKVADAVVTFWPRHQAIYQSMVHRNVPIDCVPMGVDLAFWQGGKDMGHYAGSPAVWTSENQHQIKWALDLLIAWPWVTAKVPQARLHAHYIPNGMHRFFIDLANTNGAGFHSYLSGGVFGHAQLKDMWKSFDFFLSPVRYGDHNNLMMQARAVGLPIISYAGNPYATHWIAEGDQRTMAEELVAIFEGQRVARDPLPAPDLSDMATAMIAVYERVMRETSQKPHLMLVEAGA